MAALTSPPFVVLFACSWIFVLCQGTQEVKLNPGEDATLPCRGHRGATIEVIKWIRPDVKSDGIYVFFFREGRLHENFQHPSFRGRVELRDPEMKDGDASVILKNVNINDAGTYECRVREEHGSKLISIIWLTVTVPETQELKVTAGENATLQCRSHGDAAIEVIKWIRPELKSDDGFVFFFSDGRSHENYQHESFRGRVELRDPEMKDGDASVILKNVTFNDTRTYECWVREEKETGQAKLITIIGLTVTGHTAGHEEGGDKERNVGLRVGLPVGVILLLLGVVGFAYLLFKKYRRRTANNLQQSHANDPEMQNLHREQSRDNNSDQPAAPENVQCRQQSQQMRISE